MDLYYVYEADLFGITYVSNFRKGYRDPAHEVLYRSQGHDPRVHKDYYSPSIEGYFRLPAVWIGARPSPEPDRFNAAIHHETVFVRTLTCGIEARVLRDGHFLFDFGAWPPAPQIMIPGYSIPKPGEGCEIPAATTRAEERAEGFSVMRAQMMNAHQACLATAESLIKRSRRGIGAPITSWSTVKAWSFQDAVRYSPTSQDGHQLGRAVMNNIHGIGFSEPMRRNVVEISILERSFDLLDQILSHAEPSARVVELVEACFMTATRSREKRFGEAIVLGWGVCEQLLSILWKRTIEERRTASPDTMNVDRVKKLKGRDFTASIITENLEMMGKLDAKLFRLLNVARKARNDWAHELTPPDENVVRQCLTATERLMEQVHGVSVQLNGSGPGGVPMKPAFAVEQIRLRDVAASSG